PRGLLKGNDECPRHSDERPKGNDERPKGRWARILLVIARGSVGTPAVGGAPAMIAVSKLFPLRAGASDDGGHAVAGFELLATAVLMLDAGRRVTYANPAAENLFELAKKHLVGHRPDQVFTDAAGLAAAIDQAGDVGAT